MKDQVAVVTGAGRGLGRACALEVARLGASVIVNDSGCDLDGTGSDPAVADAVAAEISAAGGTALASYADISDADAAASVIELAVERFGRIDALAHYAAIARKLPFDELTRGDFDAVIATNLAGAFYVTQPAFRHMKAHGYGRILLVGSAVGLFGIHVESNYGASKGGLHGLMRCMAVEGAAHGVLVNELLPAARTRNSDEGPYKNDPEAVRVRASLGVAYEPEHSAPLAAFLLSRESQATGMTISSMLGCFSRLLLGSTRGWQAQPKGGVPTIDDVAAHWQEIVDEADPLFPESMRDWTVYMRQSFETR